MIPSVFMQSMIAYEYALELLENRVWIPGSRMESENLRKELMPESMFLKSIQGLGPDPSIKTFIAIGDEDWVVGNWSPVIEGRDDIGYEYFVGLDHFNFCDSELVILTLLDKLAKDDKSKFFSRYDPYRNKNLVAFLSGPGIDHPDDTFDVVSFAKNIDVNPREFFDLYLRIAGRKNKAYLLKYWEGIVDFEKAQKELQDGESEADVIAKWEELLNEKNASFHQNHASASKEYIECPDAAILANGYYNELAKLIIEKVGEPVRIIDHTFNPSIVNEQKLLVIPSGGLSGLSHSAIFRKKLSEFVKNGGTIVCFSQQYGYNFNALPGGALEGYGWQEDVSCHSKAAYIENFHQILSSQKEFYPDVKIDGYFTNYPDGAKILLRRTKNLMPAMLMYDFGDGRVIVSALYSDWGYSNGQASSSEISLVRDMVRWSKQGRTLPEHKAGEDFKQAINTQRDFDKIKMLLRSPDNTVLEEKISSLAEYELGTALNNPGIYCVDYILYNSDFEAIQPQTEGFYFCFSQPPEGSIESPDFTFNITTDSENYIQGTEATFTFHIKNNTSQDETLKCKAQFNHHDLKFTESLSALADAEVSFDKKITAAKTDRIIANFYSSGNEFLGRAERGINVFEASVDTILETNKKQYVPGQIVLINASVTNNSRSDIQLFLILNVLDSENKQVFYKTETVTLAEAENYAWQESYVLPKEAARGENRIKLEVYSNSKLSGSSSVTIDIPGPLIYEEDDLPAAFFEMLEIVMEKLVYAPDETIPAKIIINNNGEKIDSATLYIKVLPGVEKGDLWGAIRDDEGDPVGGALVNSVYTNSQGRYRIKGVSKGKYTLNVEAHGYNKASKEIDILAGDNNIDMVLTRVEYGDIFGTAAGLIGSDLTLEPVGASGPERYAVVSVDSKFELRHVPVGMYKLSLEPEGITKVIQVHEGESTFVIASEAKQSQEIASSPPAPRNDKKKQETEPNNDFDSATETSSGMTIKGMIFDYGDEDYFKLSIDSACVLNISVKDVAQDFTPNLVIYNPKKQRIVSTAAFSGQGIDYSLEVSETGVYYFLLKDRYNGFSSQEEYSLNVNLVSGADEYEPNPDFDSSKEIETRKVISPTIFPIGDEDYFKFDIGEKGVFFVQMQDVPGGFRPSLKIYDSKGKLISQKGGSDGEKIGLEAEIEEAGAYYLLIRDWYSSFSSIDPYLFKAYFIKTLDEFEPNDVKEEAVLVEFGKNYFSTISTKGDSDFYKLSVPDAGRVFVYLNDTPPNIRPYMKLYKASRQSWIDSVAGFEGEDLTMQFQADEPSNYFIQVQDRYNSETSFLRYRFLVVYIPDDEYLLEDTSIFKKEINISNVVRKKTVNLDIPGIGDIGKYYLQAALKSLVTEKNAQAVERFYVSDLGELPPEPCAEIKAACLDNEGAVFNAGENARFRFRASNSGDAGGSCRIDFKFRDLYSQGLSEFLEPGAEKVLQFEFALPVDFEEGAYEAEYTFEGQKHAIELSIKGVKVEIEAGFNAGVFRLNIKNIGSVNDVDLFAEARCGDFEARKDFTLKGEEEIIFNIPDTAGQEKIYYGIYFASGKALYLNSLLLGDDAEESDISIKVIEAKCDKNTYENGDTVSMNWKLNSRDTASVRLIADLIAPDSGAVQVLDEDIALDKGANVLDREIKPEFKVSGLYRILYRFLYKDSVIAQGSIFFDVGEEVKVELRLDKREIVLDSLRSLEQYSSSEAEGRVEKIKLTVCIFSSFALKGDLKLFLDNKVVKTRKVNFEGYKEFSFDIKSSQIGLHWVYCSLSYGSKRIDSNREIVNVSAKPKPNKTPVLLTIGEKEVVAGNVLEFVIEALDLDGDELFYSVDTLPQGASFNSSIRKFSWSPGLDQAGEYFVTFSVSDKKDSASERVKIVVTEYIPPPPERPLAEPLRGMAPLEVNFSAESVDDGSVVKYEWDFDGKGVYDFTSIETGDAVFIYTGKGDFTAVLRKTNKNGQTKTHTVKIDVERNSDAPYVFLDASPLRGAAPCKVYFKGSAISSADICRYEWDFNGDGVFEAGSVKSGNVVRVYGSPATYEVEFKVTNSEGLSDSERVSIEILDPGALNVTPIISDYKGDVPIEVNFDALIDSINPIQKYQWDFEGDGIFDFTSTDSPVVNHTYFQPGLHAPTLRVTDQNNISREARKELRFGVFNKNTVKCGKLQIKKRKGKAPFEAEFSFVSDFDLEDASYLWDFDGDGVCNLVTSAPEAGFTYYDSGVYAAGVCAKGDDYFIRACPEMIYVTNGKKREENKGANKGGRQNVYKNEMYKIELSDKTSLLLPAGILETDDVVDIKKLDEREVLKEIDSGYKEGIVAAGEYREYKFASHGENFTKEMTIAIPYLDEDNDGIVDEKDIDELTIDALWFNEGSGEWKILSDVLVFPKENLVTAKTNHFSIFGIAGLRIDSGDDLFGDNGGAGGDSGTSCFIATAAYGTPLAEEVKILCEFRDKCLLEFKIGRAFVGFYYKVSPFVAGFIRDKAFFRALVRFHIGFLVKLIS
ncbi:MAG: carboxypeptidase regulatory-like domain-containing protein [Candidatus Omnitrophica bacterium]|nr:carboxypeptidase regulatory-like domain-containing protein [Candidatus Omnitrophota bacterium]